MANVRAMKIPGQKELGDALRRWREQVGRPVDEIAMQCGVQAKQIGKWEKGTVAFTYKQLVEKILPAYRVEDFDLFIDFCGKPTLADVVIIPADHFTPFHITDHTIDYIVATDLVERTRTRIDRIKFGPGTNQVTRWGAHGGHEFVLVLQGSVTCHFAEDNDVEHAKPYRLEAGMAISFPSRLFHKFANASESEGAELVAAKPSRSGVAGRKANDPV